MTDKNQWNQFILKNTPKSGAFLQSFEWGEFQELMGRKIFRIPNMGLFIKMDLPFKKSYLYSPRGPIGEINKELIKIAKEENSFFLRIEPPKEENEFIIDELIKVPSSIPNTSLLLDLKDINLQLMREKTRYNIRLSEKKNLNIKTAHGLELFDDFYKLLEEAAMRQKIKNFPRKYYEKLLSIDNFAFLSIVYFEKNPVAGGLFIDFGETETYLFGGSSDKYKNLMAPYFLHWNMIKEARKKGKRWYDFWGINPKDSNSKDYKKEWEGITRFKEGFGGEIISYPGTFELPINKFWYTIYRTAKFLKKF